MIYMKISGNSSRGINRSFVFQVVVLLVGVLVFSGCSTAPVKTDIEARPKQDDKSAGNLEDNLGSAGYYFMMLNFKFDDDPKKLNKLKRIGARISRYTERPNIQYRYFLLDSKFRNAFSLPGGYIFFTNSLVDSLGSDDMIAAVLAHEIAHITHKHVLEEYERIKGAGAWQAILGKDVFNIATRIGYAKSYELQSDLTALRYLYRAGYDPNAIIGALTETKRFENEDKAAYEEDEKNRDKKGKDGAEDAVKFLSSHPHTENRIVNVRNYLGEVYKTEKVQYTAKDFTF